MLATKPCLLRFGVPNALFSMHGILGVSRLLLLRKSSQHRCDVCNLDVIPVHSFSLDFASREHGQRYRWQITFGFLDQASSWFADAG